MFDYISFKDPLKSNSLAYFLKIKNLKFIKDKYLFITQKNELFISIQI